MNKKAFKIKQHFLSNKFGQAVKDAFVKRNYTLKNAKAAAMEYYGHTRYAEDMLNEARRYKFTFWEYNMYHFEELDFDTRRTFLPVREARYSIKLNPYKEVSRVFYSKFDVYKHFKKYYKREVLKLEKFDNAEKEALQKISDKFKRLMFKPDDSFGGIGITVIDFTEKPFAELWQSIKKDYKHGCIVEELIKQSDALNEIVKGAVNTVRITTVAMDNRVEILGACWRCSRQDSIVDNGAQGGIVCGLDENGTVLAALTEDGVRHDVHPDTGKKLLGFKIPRYDEAIAFAKELATVCPKVRYIGWDLALTDDGWVMVEANPSSHYGIWQLPLQKGTTPMLDPLMEELNLKI